MTRSILCTVVIGILAGATAFFMPHLLLGIFIFILIIKLLHCGCGRHRHVNRFEMADKIRTMSDEEYAEFKNKFGKGCCGSKHHSHENICCSTNSTCNSNPKKNKSTK